MISREDARAIVYALDPSRLVRMAYRAASSGAALAVVMLDLSDGAIRVVCWHSGAAEEMETPLDQVALAYADTGTLATPPWRRASSGRCAGAQAAKGGA